MSSPFCTLGEDNALEWATAVVPAPCAKDAFVSCSIFLWPACSCYPSSAACIGSVRSCENDPMAVAAAAATIAAATISAAAAGWDGGEGKRVVGGHLPPQGPRDATYRQRPRAADCSGGDGKGGGRWSVVAHLKPQEFFLLSQAFVSLAKAVQYALSVVLKGLRSLERFSVDW